MRSPYYINLWGEIGPETERYDSVAALLATLDELGIWQTTVSCEEQNAMYSNARLLRMTGSMPSASSFSSIHSSSRTRKSIVFGRIRQQAGP